MLLHARRRKAFLHPRPTYYSRLQPTDSRLSSPSAFLYLTSNFCRRDVVIPASLVISVPYVREGHNSNHGEGRAHPCRASMVFVKQCQGGVCKGRESYPLFYLTSVGTLSGMYMRMWRGCFLCPDPPFPYKLRLALVKDKVECDIWQHSPPDQCRCPVHCRPVHGSVFLLLRMSVMLFGHGS